MFFKNARETVLANAVQQGVGLLVFFAVPNLVSVHDFSQVTYVNILISFSLLSDFGLANVYTRQVPALLAQQKLQEADEWDKAVFWVKFGGAGVFSVVIAGVYYFKYGYALNALLLLLFTPLAALAAFHSTKHMARAEFVKYRKLNNFQAYAKIIMLPLVYAWGIAGWFAGLSAAAFMALFGVEGKVFFKDRVFDKSIIAKHWVEGLLLVLVLVFWTQLLASARFFSVFFYPDETVAEYGLVNSGYQVLATLLTAAFIPFTIDTFKNIHVNSRQAIMRVFLVVNRAIPVFFVIGLIGAETAPYLFRHFFPKYSIEPLLIKALVFSIAAYPLLLTLGNVLIARKLASAYLAVTVVFLGVNWATIAFLQPLFGKSAAAVAQMATLYGYGLAELGMVAYLYRNEMAELKWKALATGVWIFSLGGAFCGWLLFA